MSAILLSEISSNRLHHSKISAVIQLADHHAELVAHRLRELEFAYEAKLGQPCSFSNLPWDFYVALAAIEQLRIWETKGLRSHLGQHIPRFDDLITLSLALVTPDHSASATETAIAIWK